MNKQKIILTNKRIGTLMLCSALLMMFAMLQHPQGVPTHANQQFAMKWVHGSLIFLMIFNAFGLGRLVDFFKAHGQTMSLGMLFYYIGLGSMIGAALISGFVQTALFESLSADAETFSDLNKFSSILNQALAKLGVISFGAAGVFLSPTLIANKGIELWVGVIGCVVGIILTVSMLTGLYLSVLAMTIFSILIVIWHIGIAIWLIRHEL